MLGAGAVLAMIAGVFLLVCIAQLLDMVMPDWAAALIMTLALGIPAAILISKGRERLHMPMPEKTIDNVKENVEWMKNQTKS
jgi:membrane protein implicated in regulation of membrane protease activity